MVGGWLQNLRIYRLTPADAFYEAGELAESYGRRILRLDLELYIAGDDELETLNEH
jgi:hypothetical protein